MFRKSFLKLPFCFAHILEVAFDVKDFFQFFPISVPAPSWCSADPPRMLCWQVGYLCQGLETFNVIIVDIETMEAQC